MRMTTDPSTRCSMGDLPLAITGFLVARVAVDRLHRDVSRIPAAPRRRPIITGPEGLTYCSAKKMSQGFARSVVLTQDPHGVRDVDHFNRDTYKPNLIYTALLPPPRPSAHRSTSGSISSMALSPSLEPCARSSGPRSPQMCPNSERRHRRSCHFLRRIVASWKLRQDSQRCSISASLLVYKFSYCFLVAFSPLTSHQL
ncbi:hypothetical protein B0H11DRAFT_62070 [Mycena galericulata]|nr:hypothetical protein B0H11DRAFT_62070 [Mycena galericulata]